MPRKTPEKPMGNITVNRELVVQLSEDEYKDLRQTEDALRALHINIVGATTSFLRMATTEQKKFEKLMKKVERLAKKKKPPVQTDVNTIWSIIYNLLSGITGLTDFVERTTKKVHGSVLPNKTADKLARLFGFKDVMDLQDRQYGLLVDWFKHKVSLVDFNKPVEMRN